ncbi:MAG: NAD-binding protein, partial [Phycisphaerales bacterium]|nr:NAD-binding protein [Phycisphaerales bacterium]
VANARVFEEVRSSFDNSKTPRRRPVVLMGATPMAVWVCRALRDPQWSVRLFEADRARAEEVAEELDWITVINADPTDRGTFQEERLEQAEMFLALTEDDEYNILGSVWAKSMGVKRAISVVQSANYLHLLSSVGIDQAFSPRLIAVQEIEDLLEDRPLKKLATLADETLDLHRASIGAGSALLGKALRDVTADLGIWLIAGIRRGDDVFVPTADDSIEEGDTILVVSRHDTTRRLERALDLR